MAVDTSPLAAQKGGAPRSPTASRRRIGRGSRMLSSPGALVAARAPILLQCSNGVLSTGYAGQSKAHRFLRVPSIAANPATVSAVDYYRIYAPLVQEAFELLGGGHQDVKDRRVVVAFDGGIYVQRTWKEAMERILLQDLGVPACCFQPLIELVPTAYPPNSSMLIVYMTMTEAHCMAYAAGHVLEFTYQACSDSSLELKPADTTTTLQDLYNRQLGWIDTHSLITALLLCIAACPREVRRSVIHNMVFVGTVVDVEQYSIRVARALRAALLEGGKEVVDPSQQPSPETPATADASPQEPPATEEAPEAPSSPPSSNIVYTQCPINMKALLPLAEHVSVLCIERLRPDWVPWLGASLWASHWHGINPESPLFQWITTKKV